MGDIASRVAWPRPLGPADKLIQALAEEGKQAEEGDRQKVEKEQSWWSRGGAREQEGAEGPSASSVQKSLDGLSPLTQQGTLSMPRRPQGHEHRPRPRERGRGTSIPSWSF